MDQREGRRDKENKPASVYLIDHVGPVGGGQHGDVAELLHAVHLCQELGQDAVPDAAGARRAGGADGNTRQMSGSSGKKEKLMPVRAKAVTGTRNVEEGKGTPADWSKVANKGN